MQETRSASQSGILHQRRTDSVPFFEVTPDKQVVWRAAMHERMFDPAAIQILDVEGTTLR